MIAKRIVKKRINEYTITRQYILLIRKMLCLNKGRLKTCKIKRQKVPYGTSCQECTKKLSFFDSVHSFS